MFNFKKMKSSDAVTSFGPTSNLYFSVPMKLQKCSKKELLNGKLKTKS